MISVPLHSYLFISLSVLGVLGVLAVYYFSTDFRWRLWLVWALLWFLAAAAVDRWICNRPESPAALQVVLALGFALLTCRGLLLTAENLGLKGQRPAWHDWPYYVPVAAYALLWGRHNFLNFLYYDEFTRFQALPLAPRQLLNYLFQPVNDHLQPVARVYWYAIYSVFRIRYIGVATGAFVCAVACVLGAHALIRRVTPGDARGLPVVLAALLAATPHSPIVILWKGAGDSLLLTMAFFFPTLAVLAGVVGGRLPPGWRAFALFLAGAVLTTFSSSLATVLPVYVAPFGLWVYLQAGDRRPRAQFFIAAFLATVGVTLLYWGMRRFVADVPVPHAQWTWDRILGSLHGTLDVYFLVPALIRWFLMGSALVAGWLLLSVVRKARRPAGEWTARVDASAVVWAVGFLMYVVGTLQLTAARGMDFTSRWQLFGYHLFLANWGLGLACAAILAAAANALTGLAGVFPRWRIGLVSAFPRFCIGLVGGARAAGFGGVAVYGMWQAGRLNQVYPVLTAFPVFFGLYHPLPPPPGMTRITIIHERREFVHDLRRFLQAAAQDGPRDGRNLVLVPDLAMSESPRFGRIGYWPVNLNTDERYSADWVGMSHLSYQIRIVGLDSWLARHPQVQLVAPAAVPPGTLRALLDNPATGPFLHKYWPDLRPPAAPDKGGRDLSHANIRHS